MSVMMGPAGTSFFRVSELQHSPTLLPKASTALPAGLLQLVSRVTINTKEIYFITALNQGSQPTTRQGR